MKHGDFPLANLVVLLCRQLAKPLSESIVNFAKRHEHFRHYGLIIPGKIYHRCETYGKHYIYDHKNNMKKFKFQYIDDAKAENIGAQLVLEVSFDQLNKLQNINDEKKNFY